MDAIEPVYRNRRSLGALQQAVDIPAKDSFNLVSDPQKEHRQTLSPYRNTPQGGPVVTGPHRASERPRSVLHGSPRLREQSRSFDCRIPAFGTSCRHIRCSTGCCRSGHQASRPLACPRSALGSIATDPTETQPDQSPAVRARVLFPRAPASREAARRRADQTLPDNRKCSHLVDLIIARCPAGGRLQDCRAPGSREGAGVPASQSSLPISSTLSTLPVETTFSSMTSRGVDITP